MSSGRRIGGVGIRRGLRTVRRRGASGTPVTETHRVGASLTGTSTVAGLVTADGAVAGSAAGTSSVSGAVTAHGAVAGIMAGTSEMNGTVTAHGAVAGSAAGTSEMSGTAFAHGAVVGTAAGTSSMTGTVTAEEGDPPATLITANRTLHWDGSDAANTIVSGVMTQIEDLSGNGNHGTPLTGDTGGTVHAADWNGLDRLSFNGFDESLVKETPTGLPERTDDRSVYWVGLAPDLGDDVPVFVYGKNQLDLAWAMVMNQGSPDRMILAIVGSGPYEATAHSFDELAVWCVQYENATDTIYWYKNGVAAGSHTGTDMFTSNAPDLAGIGVGIAGENVRVDQGEAVVYAAFHSSSEIAQNTAYFGDKWDITIP